MSARGYILISTSVGSTARVLRQLRGIQNITTVDVITGPHDIIAVVEAPDSDSILRLVMEQVRSIRGIEDTVTCLAVPVNPSLSHE